MSTKYSKESSERRSRDETWGLVASQAYSCLLKWDSDDDYYEEAEEEIVAEAVAEQPAASPGVVVPPDALSRSKSQRI